MRALESCIITYRVAEDPRTKFLCKRDLKHDIYSILSNQP